MNLGTEIVGIAVTVAIVDTLLERRREDAEANAIAWRALHDVDHVVWVWQGGKREYSLDDLWGTLLAIGDSDPVATETENFFLSIGSRAGDISRLQRELISRHPELKQALAHLSRLARIRDQEGLSVAQLRELLTNAVRHLVTHLKLAAGGGTLTEGVLDSSPSAQMRRHLGARSNLQALTDDSLGRESPT